MHHPSSCKLVRYNFSSPQNEFLLLLIPSWSMKIWQTSHTWDEPEGQQPSHCSNCNADVYPCYPLMLSCSQFFLPTILTVKLARLKDGWEWEPIDGSACGTSWQVSRDHTCAEKTLRRLLHTYLRNDKSNNFYTWFLWNIVAFPFRKTVGRLLHTYLRTVSQLNIDCLAVFDQSLDHHSCFTYQT